MRGRNGTCERRAVADDPQVNDETDFLDLCWLPVGAGTRVQAASLWLYESVAARIGRRPKATLYHAALKFGVDARRYTLELMPIPREQHEEPLMTGPVGTRLAARLRIFQYQLRLRESAELPDEQWIASVHRLASDPSAIEGVLGHARLVPPYTWGRRVPGTKEMWTSDSALSWLLTRAGVALGEAGPPPGGRAPGWDAGIAIARR